MSSFYAKPRGFYKLFLPMSEQIQPSNINHSTDEPTGLQFRTMSSTSDEEDVTHPDQNNDWQVITVRNNKTKIAKHMKQTTHE